MITSNEILKLIKENYGKEIYFRQMFGDERDSSYWALVRLNFKLKNGKKIDVKIDLEGNRPSLDAMKVNYVETFLYDDNFRSYNKIDFNKNYEENEIYNYDLKQSFFFNNKGFFRETIGKQYQYFNNNGVSYEYRGINFELNDCPLFVNTNHENGSVICRLYDFTPMNFDELNSYIKSNYKFSYKFIWGKLLSKLSDKKYGFKDVLNGDIEKLYNESLSYYSQAFEKKDSIYKTKKFMDQHVNPYRITKNILVDCFKEYREINSPTLNK